MATQEQYVNDPGTTLASSCTSGDTTISVVSSAGYPSLSTTGQQFRIRIDSELMLVTAISGTTWTVTRGIESTGAASHSSGATVNAIVTAGLLDAMRINESNVGPCANLPGTGLAKQGDVYGCTDSGYEFVYTGSVWQAYYQGVPVTVPPSAATFSTTLGTGTLAASSDATSLLMEGTQSLYGYYIKTPTYSVPYSVQAAFVLVWGCESNAVVAHSDGTKIVQWGFNYGDFGVATQAMNSATSYNSNPYNPGNFYPAGSLIFLKISLTSSHRTYYIGDGIDWVQTYQESNTFFLTTSKVGIGAYGGSTSVGAVVKCVHYLETTP